MVVSFFFLNKWLIFRCNNDEWWPWCFSRNLINVTMYYEINNTRKLYQITTSIIYSSVSKTSALNIDLLDLALRELSGLSFSLNGERLFPGELLSRFLLCSLRWNGVIGDNTKGVDKANGVVRLTEGGWNIELVSPVWNERATFVGLPAGSRRWLVPN